MNIDNVLGMFVPSLRNTEKRLQVTFSNYFELMTLWSSFLCTLEWIDLDQDLRSGEGCNVFSCTSFTFINLALSKYFDCKLICTVVATRHD